MTDTKEKPQRYKAAEARDLLILLVRAIHTVDAGYFFNHAKFRQAVLREVAGVCAKLETSYPEINKPL